MNYAPGMDHDPGKPIADPEAGPGFTPRRAVRVDVVGPARLARADRPPIAVVVRNLSPIGFMAECPEPVGIGSYVSIEIPGIGTVEAQVRWQMGRRMGGMFLDPITLGRCAWTADHSGVETV